CVSFFFHYLGAHLLLHSFPTRRSSDLAFVLAAAGLLDGRRCTTHWMYAADLARYCPSAKVDPDVLYVDAGPVVTSAGSAAGIDRSEEHTSELQSPCNLVCRLLLEKKKT